MLVEVMAVVTMGVCVPLYGQIDTVTIRFPEGSVEISDQAHRDIAETLGPIVGNELAEVHLDSYFPYGARQSAEPGMALSRARSDAVKSAAVQLGVASELIGDGQSALGCNIDDAGRTAPVPFSRERLQVVEMTVRVKADCHPLADLARRTNPYR